MVGNLLSCRCQIATINQSQHGFDNYLAAAVAAQATAIDFYGASRAV
jgi:hypothetical protein